jgi:hypothetical protein
MKMQELFETYGINPNEEVINLITQKYKTISIPSKIEKNLSYFTKTDLLLIHENVETAKELILMVLKNLSDTYILSQVNNATESQKQGFKALHSEVLKKQVHYNHKKTSPYKKIIDILIKNNVIEKGRNYIVGEKSTEYRLTSVYFGKGIVEYELKTDFLKKMNTKLAEENLKRVLECPIATAELLNRQFITFPTKEEVTKFLKDKVKNKLFNKKGKQVVFKGKNPSRYDNKDVVFAEDYIEMYDNLVNTIIIPIVISENGGNRVITAFNFMPSVLRDLVKFNGKPLKEADYSCLHPNIIQHLYGGSNQTEITHSIVADYLNVERNVAKTNHLSFFNKSWEQMYNNVLFDYYSTEEPMMMQNLFESKRDFGYRETSKKCFGYETSLMRKNITDLNERGIKVLYCFDALYYNQEDESTVKQIMNSNAELFKIKSRTK